MAFRNLPEMPCGPILELHGQRKRFHVPYGLKRLIEDMTREVLLYQPDNIFEFLAVFMESRLKRRLSEQQKNQGRKSWQQHRWSWQGSSVLEPEELKEFLENLPAPAEQVEHHAVVIQAAFRGYMTRKKVKEVRKSQEWNDEKRKTLLAGLGIEDTHKHTDEKHGEEEHKHERRNTLDITAQNATEEELHSAIIIQSAFRGMHARKEVQKKRASFAEAKRKSQIQPHYEGEEEEGETHPEAENAPPLETTEKSPENQAPDETREVTTEPPDLSQPTALASEQAEAEVPVEEVVEAPAAESGATTSNADDPTGATQAEQENPEQTKAE